MKLWLVLIVLVLCSLQLQSIRSFKVISFQKINTSKYIHRSLHTKNLRPACSSATGLLSVATGSISNNHSHSNSNHNRTSYSELITFGLPTLGIWLLQPILSLVDTAVMGMNKATKIAEVAALGPGIAWIDSSAYLCYFLSIATTNLFASALKEQNPKQAQTVLVNAVSLAVVLGVLLGIIQFLFAGGMVKLLSGASLEAVAYGTVYAQIRALAAPVALLTMVTQSAFLAAKDSTTPLKAVLIGAAVNVIGDLWLVKGINYGIAGAAWATTASQYAGMTYLIRSAMRVSHGRSNDLSKPGSVSLSDKLKQFFAFLRRQFASLDFVQMRSFLQFCGPLFIVLLTKAFLWTFTTFAVATAGTIDLAAHQIMINFFVMFCIFGDVIAQIAATYLPYTFRPPHFTSDLRTGEREVTTRNEERRLWSADSSALIKQITNLGIVFGTINSIAGLFLATVGTKWLTDSREIASKMQQASFLLSLSALPHCLMLGLEGILIAARDVKWLSLSYLWMAILFVVFQSYVRRSRLGLVGVWVGMVGFQWLRLGLFYWRKRQIIA